MTRSLAAIGWVLVCSACGGASDECVFEGEVYELGDIWAPDDCNACMCTDLGAECTLIACDSCTGPRPTLAECFTSRGYADCEEIETEPGLGGPFACDRDSDDCRWFADDCIADGYIPSSCPDENLCCRDNYPFSTLHVPIEDRVAYYGSLYSNGRERWTRDRAMTVTVTVDPGLAPVGNRVTCEGKPGPDPETEGETTCGSTAPAEVSVGDVVTIEPGSDTAGFTGWTLIIEVDSGLEGGPRARACKAYYNDVPEDVCPEDHGVRCAEGTLLLSRVPATEEEVTGLVGAADLTFADGLHLVATFVL